jgi:predicted dehydrogenase
VKIALVGCGLIARTHASLLKQRVAGAELIFCDRNEDKVRSYASQFSKPSSGYTDLARLLDRESPEALHILTQPASHFELAKAALEAGAHVYIEKPITSTVGELDALQQIAAGRQRLLCPGYSSLGYPVVQRAKALIASGQFGGLISAHCDFNVGPPLGQIPYGRPDHWAYSLEGGILQNVIDHPMSLLADALDEPVLEDVCIRRRASLPQHSPNLMHATVCNDKQIGSFTLSYGNGNAFAFVTYFLEAGTVRVDLRSFTLAAVRGAGTLSFAQRFVGGLQLSARLAWDTLGMATSRLSGGGPINPGISGLIGNFYAAIRGDEALFVSRDTARSTVRLLENIWSVDKRNLGAAGPTTT